MDFEDIIAHFEKRATTSNPGLVNRDRSPQPKAESVNIVQHTSFNTIQLEKETIKEDEYISLNTTPLEPEPIKESAATPFNATEVHPDLRVLTEELMAHILKNCGQTKGNVSGDPNCHVSDLQQGFSKEVFRAEIRSTLAQLQKLKESEHEESEHEDTENLYSAQRSTITSMKRQLRERDDAMKKLKQKYKQAQLVKYRLEHGEDGYKIAIDEYELAHNLMETKVADVEKRNASLQKRWDDAQVTTKRGHDERGRLQATLTKFRHEIVVAHQDASKARLEAKQATDRAVHLEARAAESKASSDAIYDRITELQEIQEQMIATIKAAENAPDTSGARRTIALLGEQRSRMVGRIANILTRKRRDANGNVRENMPASRSGTGSNHASSPTESRTYQAQASRETEPRAPQATNPAEEPGNSNGHTISDADRDNSGRRQFFAPLRKIGSGFTRIKTMRATKKTFSIATLERTCEAVEKGTKALREVIVLKEIEIERMERELYEAKDHASSLEKALQEEHNRHCLENRNMKDNSNFDWRTRTTARKKGQETFFDWQSSSVVNETKESSTNGNHGNVEKDNASASSVGKATEG